METNKYIPQSPLLKDTVHLFWQVDRKIADLQKEIIIPKGVSEVIFNFSDTPDLYANLHKQVFQIPKCFINGYHRHPIHIQHADRQTFFGVVFSPLTIKNVFGIPAGEFANCCIDMTMIDVSLNSLWHRLAEQEKFKDRVTVFSNWLEKRFFDLTNREIAINDFLHKQLKNTLSVTDVAKWLCYSPRQVSRKLQEHIGMNTEQLLLYKKYLQAIHHIHHSDFSLTEIAYTSGFCDQAHFTKTFKSFSNITPKEYKKKKRSIPGHIFENVRSIQF